MDCVTVLITCTGGVISPSQIGSLRDNPDGRPLKIVGTDMTVPCIGQQLADEFYQVPSGTSPNYVERLLNVCARESVDVIFPASHEEALALTSHKNAFDKIGAVIAASRYDVLELAFNKNRAYQKLKDSGLPYPEFRTVKDLSAFKKAAKELGIDQKKIVMKPVLTRGGRGARILTNESTAKSLLNEKAGYLEANYSEVLRALAEVDGPSFPELILMEYLPGPIYSVDFLAKNGKALIIVPKLRAVGNASQTIVGVVKRNSLVEEIIARISEVFGFDYNINIEMGCNAEGVPLPFDFNPRVAASVAFCTAAGANLIYYALKMALGEEIPSVTVKDNVMMLRYFKEFYVEC